MVVSDITVKGLADYCRITELTTEDETLFNTLLDVAKKFIIDYTGIDSADLDKHEDFVIVVYVLVQDMYDNRTYYVDNKNLNHVVETILCMHAVNLL